jgi:hypothetical protein
VKGLSCRNLNPESRTFPTRFENGSIHMSTVLCFRAGRINSPQEFGIKGFT